MKGKKNQIPAASASANTPSPLDNNQGNPDIAYMNDFATMLGGNQNFGGVGGGASSASNKPSTEGTKFIVGSK